jgi:hypothetical protein
MSLLAAVLETVTVTSAKPETTQREQPEAFALPAVTQLEKRLQALSREASVELNDSLKALQDRLKAEREIIDRFECYDLAEEAKKEGFDRSEATRLQSEALVAEELARDIEKDIRKVEAEIRSLQVNCNNKISRLNEYARSLDETRRSTAIEWIRGSGRIQMDKDHVRRWLSNVQGIEGQLKTMFGEDDYPLVETMLSELTTYKVPESCTKMLYAALQKGDLERFKQYAPIEGVTTNE